MWTTWFLLLLSGLVISPGNQEIGGDPDWHSKAESLVSDFEFDAAISVVEEHLSSAPSDTTALRWLARMFEQLVTREGRQAILLHEAVAKWDRIAQLQPDDADAFFHGAYDRLRLGEYAAAEEGARKALASATLKGSVPSAYAALALRARMGTFAAVDSVERGPFAAQLDHVRDGIREMRALELEGFEVERVEAEWYVSLGVSDRAFSVLFAALSKAPEALELHRALFDLHIASHVEERLPLLYSGFTETYPESALIRWYAGYAERLVGDLAARERRNAQAIDHYRKCVATMGQATELDPTLAESSLWIEMQARSALGWSALDAGDVDTAEHEWSSLIEEDPDFVDHVDGLGRTPGEGLGRLGGRYHVRDETLSAERVSRRLAEASQEAWKWNNVAYLLREIASDAERLGGEGALDVARSTFLESWKTYKKSAALAPHEPRIINDTALVQVYHLRDDLDGAEAMLNEAIRLGEEQLSDLGPDVEEDVRFPVAMAVGDAYQNLGFLYYRLRNEPQRARDYFVKSVETNSGVRRGVVASIKAIDAGRTLGELNPRSAAPAPAAASGSGKPGPKPSSKQEEIAPMLSSPPQEIPGEKGERVTDEKRADIDWERSLKIAADEARSLGRRVLVYHRVGGGLGPSVEYLQRYLHSSAFEATARGAITLLADGLRHSFTDRRRDGRLVDCPRARGVSCGEHIACAREFERLWHGLDMGVMSRDANGLYEVTKDGLKRITRIEDTFERFSDPGEVAGVAPGEPGPAKRSATRWEEAASTELARSGVLRARRVLERRIFEPRSPDERGRALLALDEHPSPDNDTLLAALASQPSDAKLSVAALGLWRAELGTGVPLHVLQTGATPEIREAAAAALARFGPLAAINGVERVLLVRYLLANPELDPNTTLSQLAQGGLDAFR